MNTYLHQINANLALKVKKPIVEVAIYLLAQHFFPFIPLLLARDFSIEISRKAILLKS